MLAWVKQCFSRIVEQLVKRRERSAIHFDDPVGAALNDAEILVAFAAQSYRKIEPAKVENLLARVGAIRELRKAHQDVPAVAVSDFWIAYDSIAADMAPLSAHSIKSTAHLDCQRLPRSLVTPTGYNVLIAFAVFILCLMLQGFWVAGRELVNQADQIEAERSKINGQLQLQDTALARLRSKIEALALQCTDPRFCPSAAKVPAELNNSSDDIAKWKLLSTQLIASAQELNEQNFLMRGLNSELERVTEKSRPLQLLLNRWYERAQAICNIIILEYVCPIGKKVAATEREKELSDSIDNLQKEINGAVTSGQGGSAPGESGFAPAFDGGSAWGQYKTLSFKQDQLHMLQKDLAKSEAERFRSLVVEVRMLVQNLGTYFIAMLMGILGALAYIIRSISSQLREHTYVPHSFSNSIIRICLGAIAGVFGGMQAANGNSNFSEVPSLFIPFVFGYGIEILFSLLDRIVQSLAHPEQKKASG